MILPSTPVAPSTLRSSMLTYHRRPLRWQNFFNPIEKNFTIPSAGGISYSFIEDLPTGGHFETSQFRFTSNRECSASNQP